MWAPDFKTLTKAERYTKRYLSSELAKIQSSKRADALPQLTVYEKAIVYKYSNDGYESVNEQLRISEGKNISEFGKLLTSSLSKLPVLTALFTDASDLVRLNLADMNER